MKRFALILICLLAIGIQVEGQYRENKKIYDPKCYDYQKDDPYNVAGAALASVVIPGLGQAVAGEPARGGSIMAGCLGCWMLTFTLAKATIKPQKDKIFPDLNPTPLIGLLGALGIHIWSVDDAIRVAKVNNLAYRDRKGASLEWRVNPTVITSTTNHALAPGLSLHVEWPVK